MTEEAIARVEELAGWFGENESGGHILSHTVANEHAGDLRLILSLVKQAVEMRGLIETAQRILRDLPQPHVNDGHVVAWLVQDDLPDDISAALSYLDAALSQRSEK